MHNLNIQLSDPAYTEAARAAAASGLSVEAMIEANVEAHFTGGGDVPDSFFTSTVLAEIDEAVAEARQGKNLSMAQVREQRSAQSDAWREKHPG